MAEAEMEQSTLRGDDDALPCPSILRYHIPSTEQAGWVGSSTGYGYGWYGIGSVLGQLRPKSMGEGFYFPPAHPSGVTRQGGTQNGLALPS